MTFMMLNVLYSFTFLFIIITIVDGNKSLWKTTSMRCKIIIIIKWEKKSKCKYDDDYTKIPINLRHKEREYEQKCKKRLQLRRSYVA